MSNLVLKLPFWLKNIVFSLYGIKMAMLRNRGQQSYFKEFRSYEILPEDSKTDWINQQLRFQLDFARKHVPYYRSYWDSTPDKDHMILSNWPILNKADIRGNEAAFISDLYQISSLVKVNTSGTTGTPMVFYFDRKSYARWFAIYYFNLLEKNGINIKKDRWVNIGGRIICDPNQRVPPFWIHNYPMNQIYMSSYHLSDDNLRYYINKLENSGITYIVGYPSSINELAGWILRNKHALNLHLKAVFTNAEPLTGLQRENILQAFKCKVIQTYGSSEFALAASESSDGSMKIWAQTGVLEVIDPDENGVGEFLLTGLVNKAMPLIRYKVGDSGKAETNNSIPTVIYKIEGRTDDMIHSKSGRTIGRLDPIFKKNLKIREVQVVQVKEDHLVFRVVKDEGYSQIEEEQLLREATKRLGDEFEINFEYVPYIERTKNGKFRAVVSLIQ